MLSLNKIYTPALRIFSPEQSYMTAFKQPKRIVVIGAGFSGLAASCYLAKAGFEVTLVEKNETPGGRARVFMQDGFVFDMGPSWYWMPDIFESFFAYFGKSAGDYYRLTRLDPSYQIFFGENDLLEVPADMQALESMFEDLEPGSTPHLRAFLREAEYKYKTGMGVFVRKPSHSIWEFVDRRVLASFFRLDMFSSVAQHVRKRFKNPKLQQMLEFPVLFLGATPQRTPALYSLMNYADLQLGTWYPMGGMYRIIEAMTQLAESLGVRILTGQEVVAVETRGNAAKSVHTKQGLSIETDAVVGAADYHHVDSALLPTEQRNYNEKYWETRTMAPSCLIWYLGVDKKLSGLKHHNLFFDEDFARHAKEIYDSPQWPSRPLFYVCAPSVTDPEVAPAGSENLFVLMPVAPGLEDSEAIRERYFELIMERLERLSGQVIRPHLVFKRSYAHSDFINDYHAFKGNAYGLANTLMQTAFLKPALKNRRIKNLWYTGQLTVPGPGVPPALISGEVVAREISRYFL